MRGSFYQLLILKAVTHITLIEASQIQLEGVDPSVFGLSTYPISEAHVSGSLVCNMIVILILVT